MIWMSRYFMKIRMFWFIKLKTWNSRVDIRGLVNIFRSKTDVQPADSTQPNLQAKHNGTEERMKGAWLPTGMGLKHQNPYQWGTFLTHSAACCPWYHTSSKVCSLTTEEKVVMYTNVYWSQTNGFCCLETESRNKEGFQSSYFHLSLVWYDTKTTFKLWQLKKLT